MTQAHFKKICFVTGGRADFALLKFLIEDMRQDFTIQIVATGMHLAAKFGETYKEIEAEGLPIAACVDLHLTGDSPLEVAQSIGRATIGLAAAFAKLQPDLIFLLGDRSEIFAAAQAALVALIPVAHIAGGDTTEGAIDEAFRHAITKMAHLHFVTNSESAARVRQLGENPAHVYNVGHIGIDTLQRTKVLDQGELERQIGFSLKARNLLITFHPATLDFAGAAHDTTEMLNALAQLGPQVGLLFTLSNSDSGGLAINRLIENFCNLHAHAKAFRALGRIKYLNLMRWTDVVVGNSSSGIYEAPALNKPTVNIGNRQLGRLQAASVLNCPARAEDILSALRSALARPPTPTAHPYGDGHAIARVIATVKSFTDFKPLLHKHFFNPLAVTESIS